MKFKTTFALVALFLAVQGEANGSYELDDTINATVNSAKGLITNVLNYYRDDLIVCPDLQFKTQIISTSALCQLKDDLDATTSCQYFGGKCIAAPGKWGGGSLEGGGRGCYFLPRRDPSVSRLLKIVFDDEDNDTWAEDHGLYCQ
ncbi:hypothetical protein BGZ49_009387 [Haplosporangium sp. Z 27]|nr:hypothetical protein BGZ49_009387 [Haplosporangium sp. Z 27]